MRSALPNVLIITDTPVPKVYNWDVPERRLPEKGFPCPLRDCEPKPPSQSRRRRSRVRASLNLSQSQFARRLGASAMAVSRWERGIQEVPANIYIQLGNLAGDPRCWYFWGCAGLRTVDVMRVLPAARQRLQEDRLPKLCLVHAGGKKKSSNTADFVAVPLLPRACGSSGGGRRQGCRFRAGTARGDIGSAR